jgi:EAL domain-containing protein (putative c-di-GMP-specific phosphodiesterase class I)
LYQQPIVPAVVASADGPAMEVLLRLRDENGILWQPRDFLAAAERYRLMPSIDRWVVKSTITMLGNGALSVPGSRCVTLNVSGQTLGDVGFLEFVVECLDRSGVAPSQLCFEMTESAAIANLEHARRFASVLHGMGCRFALDDFGSGVGSFSNLKNLPLDFLKIDNSFTRNLSRDSVNQALVAAMIKLARTLNFRVIAEGVEDNASLDYARRMGVDFVQGNVIAKARPLSAAA